MVLKDVLHPNKMTGGRSTCAIKSMASMRLLFRAIQAVACVGTIVTAFCLLTSCSGASFNASISLSGQVEDENGEPLEQVQLQVRQSRMSRMTPKVATDVSRDDLRVTLRRNESMARRGKSTVRCALRRSMTTVRASPLKRRTAQAVTTTSIAVSGISSEKDT